MDVIVSDFDDTLFKRNFGLLPAVEYLEERNLPVYIVTYRASNQKEFILETLAGTKLNIIGIGFAESRKKDPQTKLTIIEWIAREHNIIEVLDDDEEVVLRLNNKGLLARRV